MAFFLREGWGSSKCWILARYTDGHVAGCGGGGWKGLGGYVDPCGGSRQLSKSEANVFLPRAWYWNGSQHTPLPSYLRTFTLWGFRTFSWGCKKYREIQTSNEALADLEQSHYLPPARHGQGSRGLHPTVKQLGWDTGAKLPTSSWEECFSPSQPISGPAAMAFEQKVRPGWGLRMRGSSVFPQGGVRGEAATQALLLKGDPMELTISLGACPCPTHGIQKCI